MDNFLSQLLKIDSNLRSYLAQIIILLVAGYLFDSYYYAKLWILSGIVCYVGFWIYNFIYKKDEENLKEEKEGVYGQKGLLPFLMGFSYALVLGPLSIVLFVFLRIVEKNKKS